MVSDKRSVQYLHKFCLDLGILDWIISPGSRNAPITLTLANDNRFETCAVVDERSAAFIAMGMALGKKAPIGITCTSGSASLNYAPAIAEAFYQEIPLFIVTADRPQKWINNGEGQSIDQIDVYNNYCLASFHVNEDDDQETIERVFEEVASSLFATRKGPVHLNLAFDEPLYNTGEELSVQTFDFPLPDSIEWEKNRLMEKLGEYKKIMILVGQLPINDRLEYLLSEILSDRRIVVLTETNSNLVDFKFVNCIDRTLPSFSETEFHPELVITAGGAIVSKRIKKYLRSVEGLEHWHISSSGVFPNVIEKLTEKIQISPEIVFREVLNVIYPDPRFDFQNRWLQRSFLNQEKHLAFLKGIIWSDLKAHSIIHDWLPDGAVFHQGNSSVVRYYQLFDPIKGVTYMSNRGVSGIDGSVSTALGVSLVSDKLNVLVVGDLSFMYDNNAWWNSLDKTNLLVIVVNNGGGGIFKIIDGPSRTGLVNEFFEVRNPVNIEGLANTHGVDHWLVNGSDLLERKLEKIFLSCSKNDFKGGIIEVDTSQVESEVVLKEYFKTVNPQ